MWLRLRNVEREKKCPFLLLENSRPLSPPREPQTPLSSGTPGLLINLPRNWLSRQHTHKQPMGQKCVCVFVCVYTSYRCVCHVYIWRNICFKKLAHAIAPGDTEGQGMLICCSSWGHKETETTEWLNNKTARTGQAKLCRPGSRLETQGRANAAAQVWSRILSSSRGLGLFLKAINWLEETHPYFRVIYLIQSQMLISKKYLHSVI